MIDDESVLSAKLDPEDVLVNSYDNEKFISYPSELTVTLRDEEKVLKKTHLLYDAYQVHPNDTTIKTCIEDTLNEFAGKPDKIKIRINMEVE